MWSTDLILDTKVCSEILETNLVVPSKFSSSITLYNSRSNSMFQIMISDVFLQCKYGIRLSTYWIDLSFR
jgi:hypothetical protein